MFIAPKAHAELGASSSARWMHCPGSVVLSRAYEDRTTVYAAEGTVAHGLAEVLLSKGEDASMLAGSVIQHAGHAITVTTEMEDAVGTFIDEVQPVFDGADWFGIEQRVAVQSAPEGAELYGTADAVAITGPELFVADFKFGKGVPVSVDWNSQLLFYGLAAWETLMAENHPKVKHVDRIKLSLVKPRMAGGSKPEHWEIDLIDLLMWRDEKLFPAVERILAGDETLEEGKWCRFCPAVSGCPLKHGNAVKAAQAQFGSNSGMISVDELGDYLGLARSVAAWAKELEKEVVTRLRSGDPVPGWKLVAGRAYRAWGADDASIMAEILRRSRATATKAEELIEPPVLRSPFQVEKILKRWGTKPDQIMDGLVVKPPGKPTLVPASDKREALSAADASGDFDTWADDGEP